MGLILGLSGSLRNGRFGANDKGFADEVRALKSQAELASYLEARTKARLEEFLEAGRAENLPFDEIYKNLRRQKSHRGLSNSEAALAAGLWGAVQGGADIAHLSLSDYFPITGEATDLDDLRARVLAADALLISGPVYFGDRGSPVNDFIEFVNGDAQCRAHLAGKLYAGIAVGAKRNGGQETTLIYQLIDMANIGMLVVGNDGSSTAQYGGTNKAGDVGTLHADTYGIETSIATGHRLASVLLQMEAARGCELSSKVRISIWLLQDTNESRGLKLLQQKTAALTSRVPGIEFDILDINQEQIYRCIACDICPTHRGPDEEYRCIVKSPADLFVAHHKRLIATDAIILAAYSPRDRSSEKIRSNYQRFIERTRYLRRDDYVFRDRLAAPLVLSELGSNQNLHIRMLTSIIRHQTIVRRPIIAWEKDNAILNEAEFEQSLAQFVVDATRLTAGRLARSSQLAAEASYNPIGYEISRAKKASDVASGLDASVRALRHSDHETQRKLRVVRR